MGNTNSKLNNRKVEPTMTIAGKYEVPVKKILKPIKSIKKIVNQKRKSDEIVKAKAFKIEME
tara:strand:- start:2566 stop:2751 length:186 start_codon:yes stop_codon:yes gene_type:complete